MNFLKNLINGMNTVTVNGVTIHTKGNGNVRVENNRVYVDGKDVTPDAKEISIVVDGNVDKLSVDACNEVTIKGDVHSVKTMSGDVEISGDVTGDVGTMSGDVECGNIGGNVKTMSGDIKYKK